MCVPSTFQAEVAAINSVMSSLCDDRYARVQVLENKHMTINLPLFETSHKAKFNLKEWEVYSHHEVKTLYDQFQY